MEIFFNLLMAKMERKIEFVLQNSPFRGLGGIFAK